ncbi:hypothetical protein E2C01_102344 [Portunus trituberculatus]|uniref:Uncharacterized protein n=1 Tax=Portunus trituberculatus TaxID=210409 RepID=A0A5B7KMK7_PORTR|nr:hypothetical protein [Portunus trituberculatus]
MMAQTTVTMNVSGRSSSCRRPGQALRGLRANLMLCCVLSGMCPGRLLAVRVKQARMACQTTAQVAPSLLPWTIVV